MNRLVVLLVLLTVLTTGCRKPTPTLPEVPPALPPVQSHGDPVTEAEAVAAGKAIEKAWNDKDFDKLSKYLDMEKLIRRAFSDVFAQNKEMEAGFMKSVTKNGGPRQILTRMVLHNDGEKPLTFLRARKAADGNWAVVTRIVMEAGVNYNEFYLARNEQNEICISDIYVLSLGDLFSSTLRNMMFPAIAGQLNASSKTGLDDIIAIQNMTAMVRTGKYAEGYQAYLNLPEKLKKTKVGFLYAIMALAQLEGREADYMKLLEEFYLLYSDDPSADLMALDYFFLKKDEKQVKKSLARINKWCGGDDYLLVIEANFYITQGKLDEAKRLTEQALKKSPTMTAVHDQLIMLDLLNKDWPAAKTHFEGLIRVMTDPLDFDVLAKTELYAEFAKTPQFKDVQEFYKKHRMK
jgi:tetratricopeptide (TPR) repeat protein